MPEIPEDDFFETMGAEAVEATPFDPTVQFFANNWLARKRHAEMLLEQGDYGATVRREASIAAWTALAYAIAALIVITVALVATVVLVFKIIH